MDGVAREIGEKDYRKDIHSHICGDFYMPYPRCRHCNREETVIDLRDIPEDSYATGERIIGDLENLGWVVCRGIRMTMILIKFVSKEDGGMWTQEGTAE